MLSAGAVIIIIDKIIEQFSELHELRGLSPEYGHFLVFPVFQKHKTDYDR